MSSPSEESLRTSGGTSPPGKEDATLPPPPASSNTDVYIAPQATKIELPTPLPASFGRYLLQKLLGRGGMGAVYLAHDTQLDRLVALKIPLFTRDEGLQVLARFYREARSAATLVHPNVCPVYDVGEMDGVPYLTMGYIEGKSLAEWVRGKRFTLRESAVLVRKLALALHEAYKKGVIHRDLKPGNIMIDPRSEPIIMDFGLARRERPGDARLTQMGTTMGTPAYMPPEQMSGNAEVMGPACDIYSLGVILYEVLTGRLPFRGDSMAVQSQVLLHEPPPPTQFRPDLDPTLEIICLKAMAKKIETRYASMAEFAAALYDYLHPKDTMRSLKSPPAARPRTLPARKDHDTAAYHAVEDKCTFGPVPESSEIIKVEQTSEPSRPRFRSRWPRIAGGTATVLLLAGLLALWFWPRSPAPHEPPKTILPNSSTPAVNVQNPADWEVCSGDPAVWSMENGAMSFNLNDPPRQHGWLVTRRDYSDFLLRFEFQLLPGANSGVGLRMWPGSPKPLEIQIQDDRFPAFGAQRLTERTGTLFGVAGHPAELRPYAEWNQMEIELRGWALRVAVNDKETLRIQLNDDAIFRYLQGAPPASGRIGLQHWLGSARFRKLEIKDLSGAENKGPHQERQKP